MGFSSHPWRVSGRSLQALHIGILPGFRGGGYVVPGWGPQGLGTGSILWLLPFWPGPPWLPAACGDGAEPAVGCIYRYSLKGPSSVMTLSQDMQGAPAGSLA